MSSDYENKTVNQDARKSFIISLMDLTSLNDTDDNAKIEALCSKAKTPFATPAALCIYPKFLPLADKLLREANLRQRIRLATVANFPAGLEDRVKAAFEVEKAVALGADEVDVVFPYHALKNGNVQAGHKLLAACRKVSKNSVLKVILETGALVDEDLIKEASLIALGEGADFLKTSTGKVEINATIPAARIMLETIKNHDKTCGFKAAGGVRNQAQAEEYIQLASDIMGKDWVTPEHFRFGTSSLLDNILQDVGLSSQIGGNEIGSIESY